MFTPFFSVRAAAEERGEHLAPRINVRGFPIPLGGSSGVGIWHATQHAIVPVNDGRIGGLGTQSAIHCRLRDCIEVGSFTREADQVVAEAEFAAENGAVEHIIMIDYRMHNRELTLDV